jgi:CRISPR/Cas system CSM-associated protein Csm3 (group 7 of RAMP superfamily)
MKYRMATGTLEARTAVHVGSGEGSEVADLLLRRDAAGNIVIPGTAIAGALRALLTRLAPRFKGVEVCRALWPGEARDKVKNKGCGCAVCRLMGDVEPSDEGEERVAASRLLVFNARLLKGELPMIRDSVGIDRGTGAAARRTAAKYDLEVIPAGARFELRVELREPPEGGTPETDERLLAAALGEWRARRLALGGDVGRGLGAFDLTGLHYYERDLDTPDALMAFLRADKPWEFAEDGLPSHVQEVTSQLWQWLKETDIEGMAEVLDQAWKRIQGECKETISRARIPVTTGWAAWEFTLQAKGPFLTHDTTTAGLRGFDHAPLLSKMDDWQHPVLSGSSLRGVLRSHAERIARTLASHQAKAMNDAAVDHFLRHCPACDPLARRLEATDCHTALESCDSLLHYEVGHPENKEAQREDLCLACQLFGSARNGSRLRVEDAPFTGGKPVYKMLDFLAVDRFTGGGAEHLKFDALALWKPAFKVRLWLEDPADWELGWLTLVLRDLAEGWLRVGFGAAKGFGEVTITGGIFQQATLPAGKLPEGAESVFTVESFSLDDTELHEQQRVWLAAFHDKLGRLEDYRQAEKMKLPVDSYFGTEVVRLYRLDVEQQGGAP